MLDTHTLSQLSQLKQQIKEQEKKQKVAKGYVKGSGQRFGFVVLDNGQEIYLPSHEMDKVFPDDRVKIHIVDGRKNTLYAKIVEILKTPLSEFYGQYTVQGNNHYVRPDLPRLNRYLFIAPADRHTAQPGDYVRCKITSHPYPQGKPQAKVLQILGNNNQAGIEADFIISKFGLNRDWPADWQCSLNNDDLTDTTITKQRKDLTALPFVTIDAASTLDMDDALYAVDTDNGWQLTVAIADPIALIKDNSPLDKEAKRRATSIYMPGRVIPMLPECLTNDRCSLLPRQQRLAIICQMDINYEGNITHYHIYEGIVCSKAKLSYRDVARFYDGALSNIECVETVKCLIKVSAALKQYRERDCIISDSRVEFRLILNEQKKIGSIVPQQKNSAYSLVEECMVAANRCAADLLGETGLFVTHAGFRTERLEGAAQLAKEQLNMTGVDFRTLDGYKQLIKAVASQKTTLPLQSILNRLLRRSQLSTTAKPHFAMGLKRYTTFTSPLRKYSDFFVHRLIKAKLNEKNIATIDKTSLNKIQHALIAVRQARNQMERWLQCQFIEPMVGQCAYGTITNITGKGLTVQLNDTGIEGFISVKQLKEKMYFDPLRLTLKGNDHYFELDMSIEILIKEVDSFRRTVHFALIESGKP